MKLTSRQEAIAHAKLRAKQWLDKAKELQKQEAAFAKKREARIFFLLGKFTSHRLMTPVQEILTPKAFFTDTEQKFFEDYASDVWTNLLFENQQSDICAGPRIDEEKKQSKEDKELCDEVNEVFGGQS